MQPKVSAERFWAKVDRRAADECWPWTACRLPKGYGRIAADGGRRWVQAHRVAWALTHGDPGELHVLHRCDNPPCCNPAHLFLGTNAENARDRETKGRGHDRRGELNGAAKLNRKQVAEIRARFIVGSGPMLSREYGVTRTEIYNIVNRKVWSD